jgi:hypothetical protein
MSQEVLLLLSPLIFVMVVMSVVGWMTVPSDARFRGRFFLAGNGFTVGKTVGFAMRLATGVMVYLGAAVMGAGGLATGPAVLLGAVSLVVLLIGQVSAIRRASR